MLTDDVHLGMLDVQKTRAPSVRAVAQCDGWIRHVRLPESVAGDVRYASFEVTDGFAKTSGQLSPGALPWILVPLTAATQPVFWPKGATLEVAIVGLDFPVLVIVAIEPY